MATLTMENVKYRYRGAEGYAVKEATCAFVPGQLYAVIGPSGSGKSTMLSMLAGLDLPTEGEVRFDGENLKDMDLDRYRREDISMIFQAFQLFPLLTVMENVCYPMELIGLDKKEARERAAQFLFRVGITREQFRRFPANLSGGEQQRVAIARSLASGARIILADEPTGNLDSHTSREIMDIFHELHDQGNTIVLITHDPDVAKQAVRSLHILDGRVSEVQL